MSRKVFTCFIVISLFLNKAASYGQEIQVSRDTVKVSVQEGNTSPHNERSITPKPLDIRKAVDLSSGSCPSRITFDVQNPYNPIMSLFVFNGRICPNLLKSRWIGRFSASAR